MKCEKSSDFPLLSEEDFLCLSLNDSSLLLLGYTLFHVSYLTSLLG